MIIRFRFLTAGEGSCRYSKGKTRMNPFFCWIGIRGIDVSSSHCSQYMDRFIHIDVNVCL